MFFSLQRGVQCSDALTDHNQMSYILLPRQKWRACSRLSLLSTFFCFSVLLYSSASSLPLLFWLLVQLFLLKNCIKEFLHGHGVVGVGTRLTAGWLHFSSWLVRIWFCIDFLGFFRFTCAFFISKCFSSIDLLGSSLAKNYQEVFYPYRFPFVLFRVAHRFEIALKCVCCLMSMDLREASSHTMRAGTMCFFFSFFWFIDPVLCNLVISISSAWCWSLVPWWSRSVPLQFLRGMLGMWFYLSSYGLWRRDRLSF